MYSMDFDVWEVVGLTTGRYTVNCGLLDESRPGDRR